MKRGFLNSSKAKSKLHKDTDEVAGGPKYKLEFVERKYGVLENTGRPKGYEAERPILKELVGTENLDDDRILYTSQPGIPMSATLADHPDGWTECMLPADVKRLILATPGFPSPIVRPHAISYRVAPSAGKGQGMFSTRHIRAGDLILSERPLTISPAMITTRVRSQRELTAHEKLQAQLYEWEQALKIMFDRLLPEHKVAFMALANSHQHDGSGPIGGIVRTNAVGLGNYQTERTKKYKATYQTRNHDKLTAICKEISRLNHSCSPNTTTHWDMASFSFQLYAVRDIPAGDELTYPYVGLGLPTDERQRDLEPYSFRCACPACLAPAASDARRVLGISAPVHGIDDGLLKLSCLEQEGLQGVEMYAETLKAVMELYIGLGDAPSACKYAVKLAKQPWTSFAKEARDCILPDSVKRHPLWMKPANED